MVEEKNLAGGGDSSRLASSFEKAGDRTRFTVELRPGETTIVSWKKLMKDVTKANAPAPTAAMAPADHLTGGSVHPALESRLAPPAANDLKDAAPPSRMSAVIEKIERLYMGKDSSDDEDLNDIADDDQYDTEDSFIDDAELDEYFEVDKSKTKHDGFFVNRGKLESLEPSLSLDHLPKKRRRKAVENDLGDASNKNLKVGRRGGGKRALTTGNNSMPASPSLPDSVHVKQQERGVSSHLKLQSGKANFVENSEKSMQQRDKNGNCERFDLNIACGVHPIHTATSAIHRKEGSSLRPKGNMLEKAIRELEKMVAESRPRNGELPGVDATSQGVKRRLPREIKQKLAKVARVAVSHGKVSKELLFRLMSIVGHLINLRTLKRNLKIMINTSLSANQEKDDKFQQIKKDIVDMIRARAPSLVAKAGEQAGTSDDFQDSGLQQKGGTKVKCTMDAALEDKICDLYEIFVDGLDEDGAPQVRKLYAELAELWPKGVMDNHGIKRAICHAKDRRRGLHDRNKDREKIRRKKLVATKVEEIARVEPSSVAQPQYVQERVFTELGSEVASSHNRFASNASATTSTAAAVTTTNPTSLTSSLPSPVASAPKFDQRKGPLSGSHSGDIRAPAAPLVKKKVKRKPETNLGEAHPRSERVSSQQNAERHRSHKHHHSGLPLGVAQKSSSHSASTPMDMA